MGQNTIDPYAEHAAILRSWAALEVPQYLAPSLSQFDWTAALFLIEAASHRFRCDAEKLSSVLARSRNILAPLEEPFHFNLGLNRWLEAEHEEAYSDWLGWVVQQAATPERIFRLFRLGPPPPNLFDALPLSVERECCIEHGHPDRTGRLDLVIRFGREALIVVEVKTTDAESADTAKHVGYSKWVDGQGFACKHSILLAVSAEEEEYDGFHFLSWETVAVQLRRLSILLRDQKKMTSAALVLGFAAAVEQNLLGFSVDIVRRLAHGNATLSHSALVDYLESFVFAMEN